MKSHQPPVVPADPRALSLPVTTGPVRVPTTGTTTYRLKGGRRAEAHFAADIFPPPDDGGVRALAESIKHNGQLVAAAIQRLGGRDRVVDGRCRLLACEILGIDPLVRYLRPEEDPVEVAVSSNLVRRHDSESVRALAAARLLDGLGRGEPKGVVVSIETITDEKAGKKLGISRTSVARAKAILPHPILVAAVEHGGVAVSDAYAIRDVGVDAQRRAVDAVAAGAATTLRRALAQIATKGADVASDGAGASRAGQTESRAPGAEPTDGAGTSDGAVAPSHPRSAASGQSARGGASAGACRPKAGADRAAASDAPSGTSSDSRTARATSDDAPAGTSPNGEGPDTDATEAARTALDATAELRQALDRVGHALTRFLSDAHGMPEMFVADCRLVHEKAAEIRRGLDARDVDPKPVDADSETPSG